MMASPVLDKAVKDFAASLEDLGRVVEAQTLYESPTPKGRLRAPVTVEVRRGKEWFFAAIPELEMVEEGRTPDAAVTNCLETLFEVMASYASTPAEQLSEGARAHWERLQAVGEVEEE